MEIKLYSAPASHPCMAARKMLELKGLEHELVRSIPGVGYPALRAAGFRGRTIPALRLGEQRLQGTLAISRALEAVAPDPPLFPADPEQRARVEEAERWGDHVLQPVPRRLARYGFANRPEMRGAVFGSGGRFAAVNGRIAGLVIGLYSHLREADGYRPDEAGVRRDLAELPGMLDHVDALLSDGTLTLDPPNAATIQILSSVRALGVFADLDPYLQGRPCVQAARELFPKYRLKAPAFLPADWLAEGSAAGG